MASSDKTFGVVDYVIFVGTIVISVFIGIYYAFIKKQQTNDDLLVGGRKMAVLPISLSLLATYMSAILVLGFTGEVYANGMVIAIMAFGSLFFIPLSGFLFLPTLYNLRLTSAYEYLEMRFNSKLVRYIATVTFITQIVLYMGVVIFAPALALNVVGDFPIWISILMIGGSAGLYTAIGGIKAVVWTDVFQALMMFAGMLAIIIQGSIKVGGFGEAWRVAKENNRLEFFDFTIDPFQRHTTLGLFFGLGTFWLNGYGCHQTTVQRYCSMPSLKKAFSALFMTAPLVLFTMSLALLSGVVIFANYADCDPLTLGFIKRSDQIAPHFVLEILADIPGLLGLFNACLLSGALSTVSSGLNSLAAVTWEDFCKNLPIFRDMPEDKKSWVVKGIGFFFAALTIAMGFIASQLGGVLTVALIVNGAVTGPLLGVFVLGIFLPFVNKHGAAAGMLVAHAITLWISFGSLALARSVPTLPLRIDGCSDEIINSVNITAALLRQTKLMTPPVSLDWPDKIYTISYTLQPLVGLGLTVIVGVIVSICTGPKEMTKDDEKYIHYLVVKLGRKLETVMGLNAFEMETKPPLETIPSITLNKVNGRRHSGNSSTGDGGGINLQVNGYKLSRQDSGTGSPDGSYDNHAFHKL